MKKSVCALVVLMSCLSLFALDESQRLYNEALTYYENADYGRALKPCEEAIRLHKEDIEGQEEQIKNALKPRQVALAGNSIVEILKVLNKREEWDYVNLIKYYLNKKGEAYFDDNIENLLAYLKKIEIYPEAHKLIGDIYKIEGEYDFAEMYYKNAIDNADVLDVVDERYEILYQLAEISRLKGDENEMETRLLGILSDDVYFTKRTLASNMVTFVRKNQKDTLEKYFQMYRADNYYMMNAYVQLADYYFKKGQMERSLQFCTLATITGFTKIEQVVSKRDISFEYTDFSSLLQQASFYDDVVEWGTKNNFWKILNMLAVITRTDGNDKFSDSLLYILAEHSPLEYYRREAVLLIK
ncbi:MAG: hypothetical protein MJ176_04435 [Treponema sp.]|nr:hypothetical protein [Treponema sp.]